MHGTRQQQSVFARRFDGTTDTLNEARHSFSEWLEELEPDHDFADVLLVLSELCSNAIEASPGEAYHVGGRWSDGRLLLEVSNLCADVLPPEHEWGPDDVLAPRGRGLGIVRLLSDSVTSTTAEGVLTVTARFQLST